MKVVIEMTEQEASEYLRFKRCKDDKREMKEILDLAGRLERLANATYRALAYSDESGCVEIINDTHANAALKLATEELF